MQKSYNQSSGSEMRNFRAANGFRFLVLCSQNTRASTTGRLQCMNNTVQNKKKNVKCDVQLIMSNSLSLTTTGKLCTLVQNKLKHAQDF